MKPVSYQLLIDAVTRKGQGTRNEDRLVVFPEERLFGVIDGVSGMQGPLDDEGRTAGELAARTVAQPWASAVTDPDRSSRPLDLLVHTSLQANERLNGIMLEQGIDLSRKERRFGAVHAFVLLDETHAHWVQTGDCMIYAVYETGQIRTITHDRVEYYDSRALETWQQNDEAWLKHERPDEVQAMLANNRTHANSNPGYSVLNGDPAVEWHMEYGSIALQGMTHLLLVTDGLYPWHLDDRQRTTEAWIQYVVHTGIGQSLAVLEANERQDEHCNQIPRFKMSDDKTGILLTLAQT